MAEAAISKDANANAYDITAPEALDGGEILQLASGRAAFTAGLLGIASGDPATLIYAGQVTITKIATCSVLDGGKLWWDRSASSATGIRTADSFYIGTAVGDAAYAATSVVVDLNAIQAPQIELGKGAWTNGVTDGLGVTAGTLGGNELKLCFDAQAEVAMAALYSVDTIPVADGPILEGRFAIFDIGDHAALDINVGLANASHGTDADAITEAVFIHLDGTALSILAESDDGTTEVSATDTLVDAVDDTYFELWIDCRDLSDVAIYIDGARVLSGTTFVLTDATGPLLALVHIEKTSNDTLADLRVAMLTVRSTDLA